MKKIIMMLMLVFAYCNTNPVNPVEENTEEVNCIVVINFESSDLNCTSAEIKNNKGYTRATVPYGGSKTIFVKAKTTLTAKYWIKGLTKGDEEIIKTRFINEDETWNLR